MDFNYFIFAYLIEIGRFFRQLKNQNNNYATYNIIGQKSVVGKTTPSQYSKDIAQALGYADYAHYKGRNWRRTTL
jgi:hypothetical protein